MDSKVTPRTFLLSGMILISPQLTHRSCASFNDFYEHAQAIRETQISSSNILPYLKSPWLEALPPKRQENETHFFPKTPYPWKKNILTTVFWIGESPSQNNPVPNHKSSWDSKWEANYGGYDNPKPETRIGYRPAGFLPRQNPFYIALPYNDITPTGTKPEAPAVIPWFQKEFKRDGGTVLKGRWVAVHYKGRICYAQWEDCGPKSTENWRYVFGHNRPAHTEPGLDVSPAVRDYLGADPKDYTDWKFVELYEVPHGPWTKYGVNNPFSPSYKQDKLSTVSNSPSKPPLQALNSR